MITWCFDAIAFAATILIKPQFYVHTFQRLNFEGWVGNCLFNETVLIVCFITKSFLTYSFFPPSPALLIISRPLSSSMCSITPETANIGSSYNRMRCPGVGCWFSDRSNCSHWSSTLTFTLTSEDLSLYTTLLLLLVLIQLCSPRCWHLDSNYCRTRCKQSQLRFVLTPLLLHPQQSSLCWSTFYVRGNSPYSYRWWLVNSFHIDTSYWLSCCKIICWGNWFWNWKVFCLK